MHSFDIIIPTYNNLKELSECLDGFKAQTCTSFRVIICIDGSTDNTAEFLAAQDYPFNFIVVNHPDGKNHGRNSTRNLALPHLSAKYLILLDSDAIPAPDFIEAHKRYLEREDGVSIGIIRYTNWDKNIWARYTVRRGRYHMPPLTYLKYQFFNTGNVAFRTSYFTELNGQDSNMTRYGGGDTEFAIRLFDTYHPPFFNNTDAVAYSEMNKELPFALKQMVEFGKYNLRYLHNKHPAHRNLYGMPQMKKYPLLFSIIGSQFIAKTLEPIAIILPKAIQPALVRLLVIGAIYRGFSSK